MDLTASLNAPGAMISGTMLKSSCEALYIVGGEVSGDLRGFGLAANNGTDGVTGSEELREDVGTDEAICACKKSAF